MRKTGPVDMPEWLTIVAKMIDAERYSDLTAAAIDVLTSMLPGYQVDIKWSFQSEFQDESDALVHHLGQGETFARLVIRPADLTDADLVILQSVEQLIIAGYERIRQRIERQGWRRRLQLEVDALRDTPQPDLICQQMAQLLSDLVGFRSPLVWRHRSSRVFGFSRLCITQYNQTTMPVLNNGVGRWRPI